VLAGDTRRPLRRARVTASAPGLGPGISVGTDSDGSFELTELPPGSYRISVQRSGYLPTEYGQTRPLEQSRRVQLDKGEVVEHIDMTMPKAGVITGRVTDEVGDPVEGIIVLALRQRFWEGQRQLVPTSAVFMTNDAGEYRAIGLAPGTYFVMAMTRDTWAVKQGGATQVMGFAPTYYPGAVRPSDARAIAVGAGRQVGPVDISLIPGRAVKISGVALDSHGKPFENVQLQDAIRGDNFGRFGGRISARTAADGSFTLKDVTPGSYVVAATTGRNVEQPEATFAPVTVEDADITNLFLSGSQGGTITGRVITESGQPPDIPRLRLTTGLPAAGQPDPMLLGTFGDPAASGVSPDGTFTMKGVFGRGPILVTLPDAWMVKSIQHDGQELSDVPIELKSGERLENVLIVLSDRVSRVDGAVIDAKGNGVTDATVIAFPRDPDKWTWQTRAIKAARSGKDGRFQMSGLPPGEYVAVAVDYIENGEWNDPEFLKSAIEGAPSFVLAESGTATLTLMVRPPMQQR
jgi:protocatechuate 3,4-dioxygenase beta subunit